MNLPNDEELTRLSDVVRPDDWPLAGVLAAEVIRLRADSEYAESAYMNAMRTARLATAERDEARKEAAELRAKVAAQKAALFAAGAL